MSLQKKYEHLAEKIISLKKDDLALRDKLIENGELSNGYHEEMKLLHNKNASILDEIIGEIGYPSIEKVGKEANKASWLIIQHAIGQPAFMKNCARLLAIVVAEKKADLIDLAYLEDRIAVFEERPQLYGTQFDWDINGELSPHIFDDLQEVNLRRKSIGLNSLQEQTEVIRAQAKKENQSPPADFVKRQQEITAWKKAVGWIK